MAPDARRGKAAALNFAYAQILEQFHPDPDRTIFYIVDADGRISPESPGFIAHHFQDPKVGSMQSLVRIYNRHRFLTWFQDVEFSIYGHLFQAGRNRWGTAAWAETGNTTGWLLSPRSTTRRPRTPTCARVARRVLAAANRGSGPRSAPVAGRMALTPGQS